MAVFPPQLHDAIAAILHPRMMILGERQAELLPVLDRATLARIDWSGTTHAFVARLIDVLSVDQLVTVLQRLPTGVDSRAGIDRVIAEIRQAHQATRQVDAIRPVGATIYLLASSAVDCGIVAALQRSLAMLTGSFISLPDQARDAAPSELEPSSYVVYLCTRETTSLPTWALGLSPLDVMLVTVVVNADQPSTDPLRIHVSELDIDGGFGPVVDLFRKEFAPRATAEVRHATKILLAGCSRRELRLVASRCIDDTALDSFLFDAEIERGRIRGQSLHERLIDLLHVAALEGLIEHFVMFLSDERARCVEVQLARIRANGN